MKLHDNEHLLWVEDMLATEDHALADLLAEAPEGSLVCRVCQLTQPGSADTCTFCGIPDSLESAESLAQLLVRD